MKREIKPYAFIDREGNKVTRDIHEANMARKAAGRAYAFFDCDASKSEIDEAMPQIRRDTKTPEGLQMLLHEGTSGLQLDDELSELVQYPDDYRVMSSERIKKPYEEERRPLASMRYALAASYEGRSNEDAAEELGNVVNSIHGRLNKDAGLFRGAIVYEKDGEYHLRE